MRKKLLLFGLFAGACLFLSMGMAAAAPTIVKMKCITGLKYDIKTFYVKPGADVELRVYNDDIMLHNLVIVKPGKRLAVVEAAAALGAEGSEKNYIPDSKDVLWSLPVIDQKKSLTLKFKAPSTKGDYPFVCTYPGHGFVMFGTMVVADTLKPVVMNTGKVAAHPNGCECCTGAFKVPTVRRFFLPYTGPASLAVALPEKYSYCWDSASCRLRYVWHGGFVKNLNQYPSQAPKAAVKLEGKMVFVAAENHPLRIGKSAELEPREFLGYRLDQQGYPEFHYRIGKTEVRERIEIKQGVIQRHFKVDGKEAVTFHFAEKHAAKVSTKGKKEGNAIHFDAAQSRQFTITIKL